MPPKSIHTRFFRNVKLMFNNVLIVDLEHVRRVVKVAKCKQSSILTSIHNTNLPHV
jgi:hypothetical protein